MCRFADALLPSGTLGVTDMQISQRSLLPWALNTRGPHGNHRCAHQDKESKVRDPVIRGGSIHHPIRLNLTELEAPIPTMHSLPHTRSWVPLTSLCSNPLNIISYHPSSSVHQRHMPAMPTATTTMVSCIPLQVEAMPDDDAAPISCSLTLQFTLSSFSPSLSLFCVLSLSLSIP